jgi:hypothetical protein
VVETEERDIGEETEGEKIDKRHRTGRDRRIDTEGKTEAETKKETDRKKQTKIYKGIQREGDRARESSYS